MLPSDLGSCYRMIHRLEQEVKMRDNQINELQKELRIWCPQYQLKLPFSRRGLNCLLAKLGDKIDAARLKHGLKYRLMD